MKLIYIHIPKTAGSTLSQTLFDSTKPGLWLRNSELDLYPGSIWDMDYISGHFTRDELFSWIEREGVVYGGARLMTVIRHPLDQLQSNLSFPFELQRRGVKIQEPWMLDMLSADPLSPTELSNVINKHRWLLNMQWQYMVTGLSLDEALAHFDHISIFPNTTQSITYASAVLSEYPVFNNEYHENRALKKAIDKKIFFEGQIKNLILNEHQLDMDLYIRIIKDRLNILGLSSAAKFIPNTAEALFEDWVCREN